MRITTTILRRLMLGGFVGDVIMLCIIIWLHDPMVLQVGLAFEFG
jgi:hypothetical protein